MADKARSVQICSATDADLALSTALNLAASLLDRGTMMSFPGPDQGTGKLYKGPVFLTEFSFSFIHIF